MKYAAPAAFLLFAVALFVPTSLEKGEWSIPPFIHPEATIIFGGDMLFDRTIRSYMRQYGGDHIFSCIAPVLRDADLVVANLEGPITGNSSVSEGSTVGSPENFRFTFDPSVASLLHFYNIRLVNIGNNHIMNFGLSGLKETKKWLEDAGVAYMGDPDSVEAERVARLEINSIPFSFVNWSDWTSDKTDHTVAQVRTEAEAGRVAVVYAHWGEEYVEPPLRVKALARSFIDAGAALVVGSHPHIVQEIEHYNGRYIYYSLGNFIFDQYFSDAVTHGLLIKVRFDNEGVQTIEEMPTVFGADRRPCLVQ